MNIGVVTTSFPRHAGDYAGCFVGDRVRRLLADGHHVDVIAAGDGGVAREMDHRRLTVTRIPPSAGPVPSRGSERAGAAVAAPAVAFAGGALFYGAGAPETLERGGLVAWFAAARFSAALAVAVR